VEREVRWPELRAMASTAENCGFDSIWVGDHMLYRGDGRPERGPWDAWTLLPALAASTERVRLGTLVASTAFHPPGLIARMAATIDEVSPPLPFPLPLLPARACVAGAARLWLPSSAAW